MGDEHAQQREYLTETDFPADFAWGTATAAYQIEGAANEDGKGPSIWDVFAHTPGTIAEGATGDVACDHYHRWRDDLDLMARLSHNAYRFSIAWPRVLPEGRGRLNPAGLDFYDQLVDGLIERGIAPFVTLYHWDLPQALQQERGGWESRDTAGYFADYAALVARRLGDRVRHWMTLNEPHVVVYEGFVYGRMAPGKKDQGLAGTVTHHLLLAHGLAAQALRAEAPGAQVGIVPNMTYIEPATDREDDVQAARVLDGLWHRWYLDPIFRGAYPEDIAPMMPMPAGVVRPSDLETIAQPLDFVGVNYYSIARVKAGLEGASEPRTQKPQGALTTMGWEVYPDGLRATLVRLREDYGPRAMYVTENGTAYPDTLDERGEVRDPDRVAYLREHFRAAREALQAGVPLRGYFVWSLLDNFEWAHGYTQRFGIVYTDYATQRRIPKASAAFFSQVAATNGAALDE
jgi:beta-glucosidase